MGQQPRNGSVCKAFDNKNWYEGISLRFPHAPSISPVNPHVAQKEAVCGAWAWGGCRRLRRCGEDSRVEIPSSGQCAECSVL